MVLVVGEGLIDLRSGKPRKRRNHRIHGTTSSDHCDDVMHSDSGAFDDGMAGTHARTADNVAVAGRNHTRTLGSTFKACNGLELLLGKFTLGRLRGHPIPAGVGACFLETTIGSWSTASWPCVPHLKIELPPPLPFSTPAACQRNFPPCVKHLFPRSVEKLNSYQFRIPRRFATNEVAARSARFWSAPVLCRFGERRGLGSWLLALRLLLCLDRVDLLPGRRPPGLPRPAGEDHVPIGAPSGRVQK